MIRILIFCILAQSAMTDNLNLTSKEMAEAYKYFEAMHAQNNPVTPTPPMMKITPALPKPTDLLTVLHNMSPVPDDKNDKALEELDLQLESTESSDDVEQKTSEDSHQESTTHPPIKDKIKVLEEEMFQKFLRQLFNEARVKPENMSKSQKTSDSEKRRVFKLFEKFFWKGRGKRKTTTESSKRTSETNSDITDVLDKLNVVLDKLNHNLEDEHSKANKSDAYYVLKLPVQPNTDTNDIHFRRKREVKSTVNVAINNTIPNNVKENYTDHYLTLTTKVPKVTNQTGKPELAEKSFKSKVLGYLIDSFNEVKYKIAPLARVKENMASYDSYKIGYIAASIDTLEENLNKLMKNLEGSQQDWEEKKIMDVFEKLKTSNRVLRTLMQYLEILAQTKPILEVKNLEEVAAS